MNYPPLPKTRWNGLRHEGGPYEPEWISNEDGYTADQMRAYVDADRAQREPEAVALLRELVKCIDEYSPHRELHMAMQHARAFLEKQK